MSNFQKKWRGGLFEMVAVIRECLIGRRFGHLLITGRDPEKRKWICLCDCGNTAFKSTSVLNAGFGVTCGCPLRNEKLGSHHMTRTATYKSWDNARNRCYSKNNKKYPLYGGRGIAMCERWRNGFLSFYSDMGECPKGKTLDRIDGNGDYSPENCRWASITIQNRNRSSVRMFDIDGRKMCIAEIAEYTGIKRATIASRLKAGWSIEKAMSQCLAR